MGQGSGRRAQGRPYRRDRTPRLKETSAATRAVKLEAENKRLARQLEQTQAALDVMGKSAQALGAALREHRREPLLDVEAVRNVDTILDEAFTALIALSITVVLAADREVEGHSLPAGEPAVIQDRCSTASGAGQATVGPVRY